MYILGLGGSNHGFSACLMRDGEIVSLISDERITRKKYGIGLGASLGQGFSRKYCLESEQIKLEDVDVIVGNDILSPAMYFRQEEKVELINHHLAHAYSAYYPSGFSKSVIMILDGVGSKVKKGDGYEYESMTLYYVEDGKFEIIKKQYGRNMEGTDYIENSLGMFYALITEIIGFGEHEEGKTMGLAPYGNEKYYDRLKEYLMYDGNGNITMNSTSIYELLDWKNQVKNIRDAKKKHQICADIAWAGPKLLEEIYTDIATYLWKQTHCENLCIAGGVALNSVANYKVYKKGLYNNVFVQPAAGDDGTAIGAAYYGYQSMKKKSIK